MITVRVQSDELTQALTRIIGLSQRPRSILQAAARSVRRDLQRHFRQRDRQVNALGGRRTHWWARVAQSTQIASVTDQQAVVSISEPGLGLKVTGGVIRPVEAKALTIPLHPEAHGRRARTVELATGMPLWRYRPKKGGPTFLAQTLNDDQIRIMYVLKSVARVKADPYALPDQGMMDRNAAQAAEAQLKAELAQITGHQQVT